MSTVDADRDETRSVRRDPPDCPVCGGEGEVGDAYEPHTNSWATKRCNHCLGTGAAPDLVTCRGCGRSVHTDIPEPIRPDCCSLPCKTAVHGAAKPDDLSALRERLAAPDVDGAA